MQLRLLAAENANLKAKLTEREQAAQLEMQDLRKLCIASQEKDNERGSLAYNQLQQQQQQMMSHLSAVELLASQANDSAQRISLRLDQVIDCAMSSTSTLCTPKGPFCERFVPKLSRHRQCSLHYYGFESAIVLNMQQSCVGRTTHAISLYTRFPVPSDLSNLLVLVSAFQAIFKLPALTRLQYIPAVNGQSQLHMWALAPSFVHIVLLAVYGHATLVVAIYL